MRAAEEGRWRPADYYDDDGGDDDDKEEEKGEEGASACLPETPFCDRPWCVSGLGLLLVCMQDDGSYPVPPDSALIPAFDMKMFEGKWYIAAGLNPLFDTFDCQVPPPPLLQRLIIHIETYPHTRTDRE